MNAFLKTTPESRESTEETARDLIGEGVDGIGGFSLLFGQLKDVVASKEKNVSAGLAIVSNRSTDLNDIVWLMEKPGDTRALSNSHYGDNTWPKVVHAEQMVEDGVKESVSEKESKEQLIKRLLDILSEDSLPRQENGEEWEIYLRQLRHSIFVPAIGNDDLEKRKDADQIATANGTPNGTIVTSPTSGIYGTQKQTVILVDKTGNVTFFERTLYDRAGKLIPEGKGDRRFDFQIEGW